MPVILLKIIQVGFFVIWFLLCFVFGNMTYMLLEVCLVLGEKEQSVWLYGGDLNGK